MHSDTKPDLQGEKSKSVSSLLWDTIRGTFGGLLCKNMDKNEAIMFSRMQKKIVLLTMERKKVFYFDLGGSCTGGALHDYVLIG